MMFVGIMVVSVSVTVKAWNFDSRSMSGLPGTPRIDRRRAQVIHAYGLGGRCPVVRGSTTVHRDDADGPAGEYIGRANPTCLQDSRILEDGDKTGFFGLRPRNPATPLDINVFFKPAGWVVCGRGSLITSQFGRDGLRWL
ncbi:hypothetical protein CPLU01_03023 [Colletotrichum plurivorum]|uniref:Uncharacterized protein n=1 Tax=Colletotrichum plurivorum TaxID=2175906 RepID=A0A8H6KTH4_9PEZI|nr:hypothetical protein CPLU01_03023 [Colletotrichum plurivorum]